MSYPYCLEFWDWMLNKTGKNNKASLLQRNLFVVLEPVEMITLARLLSIIHISEDGTRIEYPRNSLATT